MSPFLSAHAKWITFILFFLYASGVQGQNVAIDWEAIWSALLDYDNFPKFFQGIDDIKVLEQNIALPGNG